MTGSSHNGDAVHGHLRTLRRIVGRLKVCRARGDRSLNNEQALDFFARSLVLDGNEGRTIRVGFIGLYDKRHIVLEQGLGGRIHAHPLLGFFFNLNLVGHVGSDECADGSAFYRHHATVQGGKKGGRGEHQTADVGLALAIGGKYQNLIGFVAVGAHVFNGDDAFVIVFLNETGLEAGRYRKKTHFDVISGLRAHNRVLDVGGVAHQDFQAFFGQSELQIEGVFLGQDDGRAVGQFDGNGVEGLFQGESGHILAAHRNSHPIAAVVRNIPQAVFNLEGGADSHNRVRDAGSILGHLSVDGPHIGTFHFCNANDGSDGIFTIGKRCRFAVGEGNDISVCRGGDGIHVHLALQGSNEGLQAGNGLVVELFHGLFQLGDAGTEVLHLLLEGRQILFLGAANRQQGYQHR